MPSARQFLVVVIAPGATVLAFFMLDKVGARIGWWAAAQPWYQEPVPWDNMHNIAAILGYAVVAYTVGRLVQPGWLWGAVPIAGLIALSLVLSAHVRRWLPLEPQWVAWRLATLSAVSLAACSLSGHLGDLVSRGGTARRTARWAVAVLAAVIVAGTALAQAFYRPVSVDPALEQAIVAGDWQQVLDRAITWQQADPEAPVSAQLIVFVSRRAQRRSAEARGASIRLRNAPTKDQAGLSPGVQWGHILVAHQPDCAYAWELLSYALECVHDHDTAIRAAGNALRLKPDDPFAYDLRADAYAGRRQYDSAIADCTTSLTLDPRDAYALFRRGSAWLRKGDRDRAIADYGMAIDVDPQREGAYCARSQVLGEKGEYDKAIADADSAVRLAPGVALTWYSKGLTLKAAGRAAEANEAFNQAASIAATTGEDDVAAGVQKERTKLDSGRTEESSKDGSP